MCRHETGAERLTHDVGELPSIRNHARIHLDKHVDIVLVELVLEENQAIRFVSREVIADSLTDLGLGGAALHRPITKETKDDVSIFRLSVLRYEGSSPRIGVPNNTSQAKDLKGDGSNPVVEVTVRGSLNK